VVGSEEPDNYAQDGALLLVGEGYLLLSLLFNPPLLLGQGSFTPRYSVASGWRI